MISYGSVVVHLRTWTYLTTTRTLFLDLPIDSSTKAPIIAPPIERSRRYFLPRHHHSKRPPTKVRHFVGTINLGFAVSETKKGTLNFSLLLKLFMSCDKQTDPAFCLDPLNSSGKCITNTINITTSKDGIKVYYQQSCCRWYQR
jgi:hypothetical protein